MKFLNRAIVVLLLLNVQGCATATRLQTADRKTSSTTQLVPWLSEESQVRFSRADKTDFYPLANQFEAQINKFYCGPASAVVVLNTLRMGNDKFKKPEDPKLFRGSVKTIPKNFDPVFARYTQDQFFNSRTDKIKTNAQVFGAPMDKTHPDVHDYGIQLRQLAEMLRAHDLNVDLKIALDDANATNMRQDIIKNLSQKNDFVIVNFSRQVLGQPGGGHISPLAAYDEKSDSVLLMDINPSHQPWVWVRLDDLIAAMRTKDTVENRGYLLVSDKDVK